jgi:hypothetical protein
MPTRPWPAALWPSEPAGFVTRSSSFERASDPWVTFSPNGVAYQIAINFNGGFNFDNAVTVSKSTDGGDTWSALTTLIREANPLSFNDKESITADPFNSNYVYAVWDRSRFPSDQASFNALHAFSFRGDIWFSRTTNGGASWEPARPIFAPRANQFSIGNQIVVLPSGRPRRHHVPRAWLEQPAQRLGRGGPPLDEPRSDLVGADHHQRRPGRVRARSGDGRADPDGRHPP